LLRNNVSLNKIHHIPIFTETHRFHPVSSESKQFAQAPGFFSDYFLLVIYTGRLVFIKDLMLLKVWNNLSQKHKQARLLHGSWSLISNCELDLRRFAEMNGLKHQVTFMGVVENVNEYLQASDLFVLITEKDAFSVSLIEVMAAWLTGDRNNAGGAKDVIRDGEMGY
jgi:glycosyltransferase involved in cell wall biosynthesis